MGNNIYLYIHDEEIKLNYKDNEEILFNSKIYDNKIDNFLEESVFKVIREKYEVNDINILENNFLYLFNITLINNLCNYILDLSLNINSNIVIYSGINQLNINENDIMNRMNAEKLFCFLGIYLKENKLSHGKNIIFNNFKKYFIDFKVETKISRNFEYYFYYSSKEYDEFKKSVEELLLKNNFVKKDTNEMGRYILPIYVNNKKMQEDFPEYEEFLPNWSSIAYLKMIEKIHDNLIIYNNLSFEKGLNKDFLSLSLIDLLDAEIIDYPIGIKKSIEKGREINGKCFFIDNEIEEIYINEKLINILRIRDTFGIVVNIK